MTTITIQQLITWGIPIISALVAATFAITKYSNSVSVKALEDRLKLKEDKLENLESNLVLRNSRGITNELTKPNESTKWSLNPKVDEDANDLTKRIEVLEKQREHLLSELAIKVSASLDPRSELSSLLAQLHSSEQAERSKAIEGLIALKDTLSYQNLVDFFIENPAEATSIENPHISKWFSFFIETGGTAGVNFVVSQIEASNPVWSETAFSIIKYEIASLEQIEWAVPSLESVALRHASTSTRTKAKLLIQHLESKKTQKETEEANRIQYEKDLKKRFEEDIIPSEFIIISALRENNLEEIASSLLCNGQEIKFWRIGLILAQVFSRKAEMRSSCINAIEQILEDANGISKPSHASLLWILSQMKNKVGQQLDSQKLIDEVHALSPKTSEFINQHISAFEIKID